MIGGVVITVMIAGMLFILAHQSWRARDARYDAVRYKRARPVSERRWSEMNVVDRDEPEFWGKP